MKYFISLVVSILFLPCAFIGEFLGLILAKIIFNTGIYTSIDFFNEGHMDGILAGAIGGALAGVVVSFIIKNYYHFWSAIILPILYMLLSGFLNFQDGMLDKVLANVVMSAIYIIIVKNLEPME